ncbi:basement membrane-specific heparan sulfate proteoglycan core protein-like [Stylophora pistillata]|uniref:basement membrane-specific heparan sulfate proteoglycan core protein-like n=1 Tax=Stylophora pistillata TaxID=50429 RepID=UPI000C057572|nr:basement membrane-specific heparan sulfate proteoglycan core protein-like [Stylophora pistillata]
MIRDKIHVVRRSVDTVNGNESISYRDLGEAIKKYVRSIMKEYICQSPDRVCVAGPPGTTGVRGLPGKRGPKGIRGKKGTRGVMGPPGKPGKQGVKGDIGPEGVKGEKGNPGTPGEPGAKGEPGESLSAPKVTVSPTSNTVTENQTSTFYCSANGNPAPTVTWSKTGSTELIAGRHNKLEIRNATYNDSGNYVCTAKSILGRVRKQVNLLVEVPPRFTKIPNRVITVKRGAKASVSCQAFGFPSPNIVWSRGLVPLPQGRTSLSNGTLEILDFGPKDSGTYQCTVSNKLGSVSGLTSLNYKQTDFKATFTNLGASGRFGPTSLGGHYTGQDHDGQVALSGGIQQWTVRHTGDYRIIAIGAAGGYDRARNSALYRGRGARMIGIFSLNQGEVIQILIGQEGGINKNQRSSGGGGGTFVVRGANKSLIIAGGGGGIESASSRHSGCDARSGSSGNPGYKSWSGGSNGHGAQTADSANSGGGGGGFYSSGRSSKQFGGTMGTGGEGGKGFLQGGVGGRAKVNNAVGGFGGGAGAYGNGGGGGGGGGYSGGSSGENKYDSCGGGGGSYNAGKNQQNECCYRSSGHGQVIITLL